MHSAGAAERAGGNASFGISSHRFEHGIVIKPTGEVDLGTASIVEDELRRAEESEDLIVLDLGGISFMDSTGVRMVVAADRRLRERGGALRLTNLPRQVEKLFRLVGIADHLTIDGGPPEPRAT